ncbi:MAG: hypothetical protein QXY12_05675 [Pyrobaculum sp.]
MLQPGMMVTNGSARCTLSFPAGDYIFTTAGHCFPIGARLYVDNRYIGTLSRREVPTSTDPNNPSTDLGVISLSQANTAAYNPRLHHTSSECSSLTGPPYLVRGYARESSYLFFQNAPVIFNGASSGCIIVYLRYLPGTYKYFNYYVRAFLVDPRMTRGDSGAPAALTNGCYTRDTPVWIGGVHSGRDYYNGQLLGFEMTVEYGSRRLSITPTPASWS